MPRSVNPLHIPWHTDVGDPLWTGARAADERRMAQAQAETTFRRYLADDGSRSSTTLAPLHGETGRLLAVSLMAFNRDGVFFARHDGHNLIPDPLGLLAHLDDRGEVANPILLISQVCALVQHANGSMDAHGVLWVEAHGRRCPIIPTELRPDGDKQQFRDITLLVKDPEHRPALAADGSLSLPATWAHGQPVMLTSMEHKVLQALGCEGRWSNGKGAFDLTLDEAESGEPQLTLTMVHRPHLLFNGNRFTCKERPATKITLVIPSTRVGGITVKAPKNSMSGNDKNNGHGGDMEAMGTGSRGQIGQLNALPVVGYNRRGSKQESERLSVTRDYVANSCESERLGAVHHQDLPTGLLMGGWMVARDGVHVLPEVAFEAAVLSRLALIALLRAQADAVPLLDTPLVHDLHFALDFMIQALSERVETEDAARWEQMRFVGVGGSTSQIEPPLAYAEILRWKRRAQHGAAELAKVTLTQDGLLPSHSMATGPFAMDNATTAKKQAEDVLIQADIESMMLGHSVSHMAGRLIENVLTN